jgi:predicted small metal-binding protein
VAKDPTRNLDSELAANPSVNPKTHAVNPSAPTTGTEGWGNTADERQALSENPPSLSKDGQTSRNVGTNQAELSGRTSATATSMNVTHEGHDRTFRCSDAGNADCRWETSGASDEEILGEVHRHGQTEHGWNDWTDAMRSRVRDAIRERRAA